MSEVERFYWQGDNEIATVFRPTGEVLCIICKRKPNDESAIIRAIEIVFAMNHLQHPA